MLAELTMETAVQRQAMMGSPLKRKEDFRFLLGKATYITDVKPIGSLCVVFVRSTYAHAKIKKIETTEARASRGVRAVYIAEDLRVGDVPCAVQLPFARYPRYRPIASEEVNHVGEIVAIVVAENEYLAKDAAELVQIDYEVMEPVVDAQESSVDRSRLVHQEFDNNICYTMKRRFGQIDEAFAQSARIFSFKIYNQRVFSAAIEPRAVIANYDEASDELTVWSSTQYPHIAQTFISNAIDHPENKMRVIAPDLGGGFGGKSNVYAEEILIPLLSKLLKCPVRWVEERSESLQATAHGRDVMEHVEVGVTNEGKIQALRLRLIADAGAYLHFMTPAFPLIIVANIFGNYKIGSYEYEANLVFTNKKSTDAYRGVANAEANYCMERVMDMIATKLQIDPVQVRLTNCVQEYEYPHTTVTGLVYESGDLPQSLKRAIAILEYPKFREDQQRLRKIGRYVGIGFSSFWEHGGLGPSRLTRLMGTKHGLFESALVRVLPSGKIIAITGSSSHGQGHETSFAQIVADELNVSPSSVNILHGDTLGAPYGIGTFASRSAAVGGTAIYLACEKITKKAKLIASALLDVPVSEIEFDRTGFHVKDSKNKSVSMEKVIESAYLALGLPPAMEPGLEAVCYYAPPDVTYSSGTHAAVVEIDMATGKARVLRYIAVNDFGTLINPMIVDGQVHGGVVQGIGQALLEEIRYNSDGQFITSNFLDYLLPTSTDPMDEGFSNFEIDYYQTRTNCNPLNVKGMGESGTIAAPAAIANAIMDALESVGENDVQMPFTPEKLWSVTAGLRTGMNRSRV